MLIICPIPFVPCSYFTCLLLAICVSAYIYFSYVSTFLLVADGQTLNITAGSMNITVVRGHNPVDRPPDDRLAVNVNGPNREVCGGWADQPADGGDCGKTGPKPEPTACFLALFVMSVCAFLFCTVFPEYCLRRKYTFNKSQHIFVRKKCGCCIEYSALPEQP